MIDRTKVPKLKMMAEVGRMKFPKICKRGIVVKECREGTGRVMWWTVYGVG